MYAKLFTSIYQGTLRGNSHGLLVFTNLLAHCDKAGIVDMHPRAIAEEVGLSVDQVRAALDELERPDDESRSPENEGRRIVRLDEHRSWGWLVVNYTKYRAIRDEEDRREQNRLSQERWRNRNKPPSAAVSQDKPQSAHTEAEAEAVNPPTPLPGGFVAFWNAWPQHHRKAAKPQCLRKWQAKGCEAFAGKVVAAVNAAKRSADWQKDGGAFIPAPLAWLNQERWEAPVQAAPEPPQAEVWKPPASLSPAEQAAANEARKAAMQAIKRVQT